jgi:hypothetical protein
MFHTAPVDGPPAAPSVEGDRNFVPSGLTNWEDSPRALKTTFVMTVLIVAGFVVAGWLGMMIISGGGGQQLPHYIDTKSKLPPEPPGKRDPEGDIRAIESVASKVKLVSAILILLFAGTVLAGKVGRRNTIFMGSTREENSGQQTLLFGTFHKQRLAILMAAGLGMVATFLPWWYVPIIGAISGTKGDGWLTLALFAPAVIATLLDCTSLPMLESLRLAAIIQRVWQV